MNASPLEYLELCLPLHCLLHYLLVFSPDARTRIIDVLPSLLPRPDACSILRFVLWM